MEGLLLGVDGGATKTVALVADAGGTVRGAARAGSSDIHAAAGPAAGVASVVRASRDACAAADVAAADLAACAFSLCGADWPEDVDHYAGALLEALDLREPPLVVNDAFGPLLAGTSDGIGVALVLGTGAAIAARGPTGSTWFSGERMEAAGALELGRLAHQLLIRGEYGSGPVPGFQAAALAAFGVDSVEALLHVVSRVGGPGRQALARLAPVLLEAGHEADPAAQAVIREQGQMLASYVRAAAHRVSLERPGVRVVLAGGLLRHHCTDLVSTIEAGLDGFSLERASVEPVYGALLMAADLVDARPGLERLRRSGPQAAFFETL